MGGYPGQVQMGVTQPGPDGGTLARTRRGYSSQIQMEGTLATDGVPPRIGQQMELLAFTQEDFLVICYFPLILWNELQELVFIVIYQWLLSPSVVSNAALIRVEYIQTWKLVGRTFGC